MHGATAHRGLFKFLTSGGGCVPPPLEIAADPCRSGHAVEPKLSTKVPKFAQRQPRGAVKTRDHRGWRNHSIRLPHVSRAIARDLGSSRAIC